MPSSSSVQKVLQYLVVRIFLMKLKDARSCKQTYESQRHKSIDHFSTTSSCTIAFFWRLNFGIDLIKLNCADESALDVWYKCKVPSEHPTIKKFFQQARLCTCLHFSATVLTSNAACDMNLILSPIWRPSKVISIVEKMADRFWGYSLSRLEIWLCGLRHKK